MSALKRFEICHYSQKPSIFEEKNGCKKRKTSRQLTRNITFQKLMMHASLALSWIHNCLWMISFVRGLSAVDVRHIYFIANTYLFWPEIHHLKTMERDDQGSSHYERYIKFEVKKYRGRDESLATFHSRHTGRDVNFIRTWHRNYILLLSRDYVKKLIEARIIVRAFRNTTY